MGRCCTNELIVMKKIRKKSQRNTRYYYRYENNKKFKAELLPPNLIVKRYFFDEKLVIDNLETLRENILQEVEELTAEHSGEEGLLEDAKNDKGKLQKKVLMMFEEIKGDEDYGDKWSLSKKQN